METRDSRASAGQGVDSYKKSSIFKDFFRFLCRIRLFFIFIKIQKFQGKIFSIF